MEKTQRQLGTIVSKDWEHAQEIEKLTIKTYGKRHNKLGITTSIHELPQPSKQREIDY